MRKLIVHGACLAAVAASIAGCGPAATSSSGSPTPSSPVTVQPSGASTAASNPSAAPTNISSGGRYTGTPSATASAATGPLGLLPIPSGTTPWTSNTDAPMSLVPYINTFFIASAQVHEKSMYTRRVFVSGGIEGWINLDGSQQRIAIARFATANGALSAFDDLSSFLSEKPAPWTVLSDSADGAVGSADPQPDANGFNEVDIAGRVGDYLVDVREFTIGFPNSAAAKALLLQQVKALENVATKAT